MVSQSNLHKYQWIVTHSRVKKSKTASIFLESATQIIPAIDLVHRLVCNQLLEHDGWGLPVDVPQLKKTLIEPGNEQVLQVGVNTV